jgi:hypothetical protein
MHPHLYLSGSTEQLQTQRPNSLRSAFLGRLDRCLPCVDTEAEARVPMEPSH